MSIIYTPSGKAREYSPLAVNLYTGCNHECKYCYAPAIRRMERKKYSDPILRRNVLRELERDCRKYYNSNDPVLLCFMTDPYNAVDLELRVTREALKMFLKYKIPVSVLTKAGTKALCDIDVFKRFKAQIQVGATLTFDNDKDSKEWEPNAALPSDRLGMLKELHKNKIKTWASFEPVIKPEQSIELIKQSLEFIDVYKIGKLNNFQGLDKEIDWTDFLKQAVSILRNNNKQFYIKHDLRIFTSSIRLFGSETIADEFNVPPFQIK